MFNMNGYKLIQVDFDSMENRDPLITTELGFFVDDADCWDTPEAKTAHSKVREFMAALEPCKMYVGYDNKIYPQFIMKHIEVH